jgi:dipeptidase
MCDTFYIPAAATRDGHAILAKNSDREPNEAQHLVRFPERSDAGKTVRTSYREMPHHSARFEVILSKPFQLWGAEMGINAHRVAIGNEAVFTRIRFRKKNDGLTGMDMIRLALESCTTAGEALHRICSWVENPGQDACGGYMNRDFFYHNSFLIADPLEAFVLETAGPHWAWKKLHGFYAISNRLTIGKEYDGVSKDAVTFARTRGWSPRSGDFDFAAAFTAPFLSRLSGATERRAACTHAAAAIVSTGTFTIGDAFGILRSHKDGEFIKPGKARMDNLCLHASGLLTPSQTTGSMVMELRHSGTPRIWATGTAAPCLSLYKPVYFGTDTLDGERFSARGPKADSSYWWAWEQWHRRALARYPEAHSLWKEHLAPLERSWMGKEEEMIRSGRINDEAAAFSNQCFDDSLAAMERAKAVIGGGRPRYTGLSYGVHWNRWNRQAGIK